MKKYSRSKLILVALAPLFIGCMTSAAFATNVTEQPPTPLENARAILTESHFESSMNSMLGQLLPIMESGFIGNLSTIAFGQEFLEKIDAKYPGGRDAFGKRFGELVAKEWPAQYPVIMERTAQQYVAVLSPEDLSAIRAFYETPTGVRMLTALPELQQKMSAVGREVGAKAGRDAAARLMTEAEHYLGKIR